MAMDLSNFDESETCQLIDSILKEESEETNEDNCNSTKVSLIKLYFNILTYLKIRKMKQQKW